MYSRKIGKSNNTCDTFSYTLPAVHISNSLEDRTRHTNIIAPASTLVDPGIEEVYVIDAISTLLRHNGNIGRHIAVRHPSTTADMRHVTNDACLSVNFRHNYNKTTNTG